VRVGGCSKDLKMDKDGKRQSHFGGGKGGGQSLWSF